MGWGPELDEAEREKRHRARILARVHERVNKAQGLACEDCGTVERPLHMHHEDYNKPRAVTWLCAACHLERHRRHRGVRDLDGLRQLVNQVRDAIDRTAS